MNEQMNVKEVASYLRLHQNTVYRLIKNGEIPSTRLGTNIRIDKGELDKYLSK